MEVSRAAEETDKESAWWRGYFVRAGRLGSQTQATAAAAAGLDSAKLRVPPLQHGGCALCVRGISRGRLLMMHNLSDIRGLCRLVVWLERGFGRKS